MISSYADPRLAACYNVYNAPTPGDAFYIDLASDPPRTVLDIGCGTGRLARALAQRGHRVTAADPSSAMLAMARKDDGARHVTWIEADGTSLDIATRFDLIIMTGHAFQILLEDDAVRATLRNLRRHLARGGVLAFETRNPTAEEWRNWTPDKTRETIDVPGIGPVTIHNDIAASSDRVTYETHYRFGPDDVVVARDTIRFMDRSTLAHFLHDADFIDVTWYGNWDRSPVSATSPEIIAIAR